jgi:hypothetical protein
VLVVPDDVLGLVAVDCPIVLPGVVPAVVPDVEPAVPDALGELVEPLLVVVLGPVLLLLPPIPLPVEPDVWAPATPNASRRAGAANHVFRIVVFLANSAHRAALMWRVLTSSRKRLDHAPTPRRWLETRAGKASDGRNKPLA